jgi:glutamate-1-semialdehyde 2,1-aminomutase
MGNIMKIIAIIQARVGSIRLPNKVMKQINGIPMIELLLTRLSKSKKINKIILATSINKNNFPLVKKVEKLGYSCEQGSENDVLDRYFQTAKTYNPEIVIRITGDCPLVDPILVDAFISKFEKLDVDYLSNTKPPTYPDGLDIEIMTFASLKNAWKNAKTSFHREHVTPYILESDYFKKVNIENKENLSNLRWTLDEQSDFQVLQNIFKHFSPDIHFSWKKVLKLHKIKPHLFTFNKELIRNEGKIMGSGQKLWKNAKLLIPGGNMFLSKRPEMFLPNRWPAYFKKSKGCKVWDLDGRELIDMSIMSVGTNILGYGEPEVDSAVHEIINLGNMSTLNCPEEVFLVEKLISMHPWADMARLARTGGEANSIAIRIARAASGREKVAICGYHGWHDWYLSANLVEGDNLNNHLLPGLDTFGVPSSLKNTVFTFNYNNFEELETLIKDHEIGVIKMEVSRNVEPKNNFLQKIRKLANDNNIVLIFDECTSGFRETFGGLHKKYNIEPDIAVFGKAMGNGYSITAIIGKRNVMESAQSTFISSTFWSERIGPTAALKTLEVMERTKSWEIITQTGRMIRQRWQKLADKHELKINHWGLPALTGYSFKGPNALAYKTLITQEMLEKGYLATNSVYVCTEHTSDILDGYFDALNPIFKLIKECEEGRDVNDLLQYPVCHSGFRRLN